MNRKGFAPIVILLIVVGIFAIGGALYYTKFKSTPTLPSAPAQTQNVPISQPTSTPSTSVSLIASSSATSSASSAASSSVQAITRGDSDLVLQTLTGGETIVPGQTYKIQWTSSQGILYYTNEVRICLLGLSNASTSAHQPYILDLGNIIPATTSYNDILCTYMSGSVGGSYLIATTTITSGAYAWTVPVDIASRFISQPDSVRVELIALDNRPAPTSTDPNSMGPEWEGAVGWSESGDSLSLAPNSPRPMR